MRHRSSGKKIQEAYATDLMERDFVRVPLRFLIHYREYPASQFQPMSQDFESNTWPLRRISQLTEIALFFFLIKNLPEISKLAGVVWSWLEVSLRGYKMVTVESP